MMREDDPRLTFFPQDEPPKDGMVVVTNEWWIEHPEKGLVVFQGDRPQCNRSEDVAKRLAGIYPWARVVFHELAFVRIEER